MTTVFAAWLSFGGHFVGLSDSRVWIAVLLGQFRAATHEFIFHELELMVAEVVVVDVLIVLLTLLVKFLEEETRLTDDADISWNRVDGTGSIILRVYAYSSF